MTDATQPRMARGTMLPAGILAAALFALLAFAPFASAASDPVASGTTTITLNSGFVNALKKGGVKLSATKPAKVKGKNVTLTVSGGSIDPTTGLGTLTHSGGLKLKAGKKSVTLSSIELNTSTKSVSAKLGKKKLKVASVASFTFARDGFGVDVKVGKLKLTSAAAKQLNKALAPAPAKKGKKSKRASTSKAKAAKGVFKANQVIGGSSSTSQPSTVAVLPGGNATLATNEATIQKLTNVGAVLAPVAPTAETAPKPQTFAFPIVGESISPTAVAGIVKTTGGLNIVQNLEALGAIGAGTTTLTLGNVWVDLATKAMTVEVIITNPKTAAANLGNLGRVSIADISGGTVTTDPTTHTVSVQGASAALQELTATTLNSVFVEPVEKVDPLAKKFVKGDLLGTLSFTAQTQ
jgi:hypothetical protein